MSIAQAIDFRPDPPEFVADPYPILRRMHEEDPVHWSQRLKSWVLTRYDDVKAVCLDREISSDRLRPFFATLPGPEAQRIGDIIRYLSLWMVFRDPPEHTRLRRLTAKSTCNPCMRCGRWSTISLAFAYALGETPCKSFKGSPHVCGLMIKPKRQLGFIPLSSEIQRS
jgi:hypothetical protein